jgi:hypothetical protein
LAARNARVCCRCDRWFAARSRERVCDGCSPAKTRTLRALKGNDTGPALWMRKTPGQKGVEAAFVGVYSDDLGLTFRCKVSDPRAGGLLCRVLAYEEAARDQRKHRARFDAA